MSKRISVWWLDMDTMKWRFLVIFHIVLFNCDPMNSPPFLYKSYTSRNQSNENAMKRLHDYQHGNCHQSWTAWHVYLVAIYFKPGFNHSVPCQTVQIIDNYYIYNLVCAIHKICRNLLHISVQNVKIKYPTPVIRLPIKPYYIYMDWLGFYF